MNWLGESLGSEKERGVILNYETDGFSLFPRTLSTELLTVYDEYQREALTSLVSALEREVRLGV